MQEKTAALAAQILHTFASPDDSAYLLGGQRYHGAQSVCSRWTGCAGVAGISRYAWTKRPPLMQVCCNLA